MFLGRFPTEPVDDQLAAFYRRLLAAVADPTRDMCFERPGDDLVDGLFVGLDAWQWHLLRLDPSPEPAGHR